MFFSIQLLGRGTPLSTLWLAAHADSRLKRNDINTTSVKNSVGVLSSSSLALCFPATTAAGLSAQISQRENCPYANTMRKLPCRGHFAFRNTPCAALEWNADAGRGPDIQTAAAVSVRRLPEHDQQAREGAATHILT
jgi:hypothetical protein